MDYLKKLQKEIGGKIKPQNKLSGNVNGKSTERLEVSNLRGYKVNISDFGTMVSIEVKVNSEFGFSINRADNVFAFIRPTIYDELDYTIYRYKYDDDIAIDQIKPFVTSISGLLKELQLQPDEGVFVYSNLISFVVHLDKDIPWLLEKVIDAILSNPDVFTIKQKAASISSRNVPPKLKPLLLFVKKWAISDDAERQAALEKIKAAEKKKLLDTVVPLMREVNEYLASFKDKPMPNEATLIGNLAELVSEIQIS